MKKPFRELSRPAAAPKCESDYNKIATHVNSCRSSHAEISSSNMTHVDGGRSEARDALFRSHVRRNWAKADAIKYFRSASNVAAKASTAPLNLHF
jgi:hypothetical protein